jgi:uncharacterized membrane protein
MVTTPKENTFNRENSRIESFSDGVFAIAITLLILDIHVPEFKPGTSLYASLSAEWASIVALLIGFFTILICWINHHYMFQLIHRSDSILLMLNGLKLLVVTATPFATALLSKHFETSWAPAAASIYCFNFALMGLSMTAIWFYANAKGFTHSANQGVLRESSLLYLMAGVFPTIILIISFLSIPICLVLSAAMFALFIAPKQTVDWRLKRKALAK